MSNELLPILLTLGIAAFGVLIYLWTAGSSLIRAIEIHTLRVDAHTLRLEYARRIAELAGEPIEVSADLDSAEQPAPATHDPPTPTPTVTARPIGAAQPARAAA
ncbi:MAG: hypothetical protein ACTS3F_04320 [Phycisphaerales bacterium]